MNNVKTIEVVEALIALGWLYASRDGNGEVFLWMNAPPKKQITVDPDGQEVIEEMYWYAEDGQMNEKVRAETMMRSEALDWLLSLMSPYDEKPLDLITYLINSNLKEDK